jgi:hypothetical protein
MAWFLNVYRCGRCKRVWTYEWSHKCDDECPHCRARDMSPCHSEDLTQFIAQEGGEFVAFRSPDTADHDPDYEELGRFPTHAKAEAFLAELD